jgi:hypothetical protein
MVASVKKDAKAFALIISLVKPPINGKAEVAI